MVLALTLLISLAQAEPADAARLRFAEAQRAYDLGRFENAMQLYSEAYELLPLPAFLFNIGQCHRQLKQWDRAAFYYRRFTAKASEGPELARALLLIDEMDAREEEERQKPAPAAPVIVARPVLHRPGPESDAPKQVALEPAAPAPRAPPPIVAEPAPSNTARWVLLGAGATVVTAVAVGVAVGFAAQRQQPTPGYGTLDAR